MMFQGQRMWMVVMHLFFMDLRSSFSESAPVHRGSSRLVGKMGLQCRCDKYKYGH